MEKLFENIYVINMDRRVDRRIFVEYRLKKVGITNYQIFSGTDGYTPQNKSLYNIICEKNHDTKLTSPGALGIIITFRKLLEDAIEKKYENILIFEDDCVFHKNFWEELSKHIDKIKKYPVFYLGANQFRWTDEQINKVSNNQGYHTSTSGTSYSYGCFGISIRKDFYTKILSKIFTLSNIKYPIDVIINFVLRESGLPGYVCYPNLVIADVTESDNMGGRDQDEISKTRRWIMDDYEYQTLEEFYKDLSIKSKNLENQNNISKIAILEGINYGLIKIPICNSIIESMGYISNYLIKNKISLRQLLYGYTYSINYKTLMNKFYMFPSSIIDAFSKLFDNKIQINIMTDIILPLEGGKRPFVFIVPSRNNAFNYVKNLQSIYDQNYNNYRILYIEDVSDDGTYDYVKKYILDNNENKRTILMQQNIHQGQGAGRFICYHYTYDDEIVIMLDGDDWLFDREVLNNLEKIYNQNNLLCSYGSYYEYDNKLINKLCARRQYPENVKINKTYRNYDWICAHLRTGMGKLFKNIKYKDVIFENKFLEVCTDFAEMMPVLEMAGTAHMNTTTPLYVYNKSNSILYNTSYYNIDKPENVDKKKYREIVMQYLKNISPYATINYDEIHNYYKNIDKYNYGLNIVYHSRMHISGYDGICKLCQNIDDINPEYRYTLILPERVINIDILRCLYYIKIIEAHVLLFDVPNHMFGINKKYNYITPKCTNSIMHTFISENDMIEIPNEGLFLTNALLEKKYSSILFCQYNKEKKKT